MNTTIEITMNRDYDTVINIQCGERNSILAFDMDNEDFVKGLAEAIENFNESAGKPSIFKLDAILNHFEDADGLQAAAIKALRELDYPVNKQAIEYVSEALQAIIQTGADEGAFEVY